MNITPPPPLKPDVDMTMPSLAAVEIEIVKITAELQNAMRRHRGAWIRMSQLKQEARDKGNAWFMDNERSWRLATSDVSWWRGEVSAAANALTAMFGLIAHLNRYQPPSRQDPPKKLNVRQLVDTWTEQPGELPSDAAYRAACAWVATLDGASKLRPPYDTKVPRLMRVYEASRNRG